jgi:hypothetical protein
MVNKMGMRNARMLRLALRLISSSIDSDELQREEARIDIDKPYRPRKLKTDQSHKLAREAYKLRPQDSARDAREKRTRDKWERDNKPDLKKRAEFVRKQKKMYGYDKGND